MIAFRRRVEHRDPGALVPPDLSGYIGELPQAQTTTGWHVVAPAPVLGWGPPPAGAAWVDIGNGWQAILHGPFEPAELARAKRAVPRVKPVADAQGRTWLAPEVLTAAGERAFPVAFAGKDWTPTPTPEQREAEEAARNLRALFLAHAAASAEEESAAEAEGRAARPVPSGLAMRAACHHAAGFLALSHHLTRDTIAALGLLDEVLIRAVLRTASGLG